MPRNQRPAGGGAVGPPGGDPVSLWIDQTTSYPVRYEMELTALMNAIAGHLAEAAEAEGPEVCYTKTSRGHDLFQL